MPPAEPTRWLWADSRGHARLLTANLQVEQEWAEPAQALSWLGAQQTELRTGERWVGYLGYDLGGFFERLPRSAVDDLGLPLLVLGLCGQPASSIKDGHYISGNPSLAGANFTHSAYEAAVARAIEYVRTGDIFQVNLSQRLVRGVTESARNIYNRLLSRTPAWYGALLELPPGPWGDSFEVVSNSPELFLHLTPAGEIVTRPIKGTRPAAAGMHQALDASIKDRAELAMIVDLLRNDLGRVAEIGSVRVTEPRVIEAHPTVYHGVATIRAKLRAGLGLADLLAGTFPSGSVTGCPKIRAMQIIDELEPTRRGVYCGSVGYIARESSQWNVAIRTMTVKAGKAYIPVGGGIVADSTPAGEYEETLVKARAILGALNPER